MEMILVAVKGKGFPYSLPSIGPRANPGVQAVSPHVTISHPSGGRLPLLSARHLPSHRASPLLGRCQVMLLGDRGMNNLPNLFLLVLAASVSL